MQDAAPSLRQTQVWMVSLIVPPEGSQSASAWGSLSERLSLPEGVSAEARMHVYAGGYRQRLRDAMAESYPALAHVLGEGAFAALVDRCLRKLPPRSYNLNDAGAHLAELLRSDKIALKLPFLSDLARLEWAIVRAFRAPTASVFDPAVAADWTLEEWAEARIDFQPGTALVRSAWPIRAVWESRETPVNDIDIDMTTGPEIVLVRRAGFEVECETIGEAEAMALDGFLEHATMGEVSERLEAAGLDAVAVAEGFVRWARMGLIVACARERNAVPRPEEHRLRAAEQRVEQFVP